MWKASERCIYLLQEHRARDVELFVVKYFMHIRNGLKLPIILIIWTRHVQAATYMRVKS